MTRKLPIGNRRVKSGGILVAFGANQSSDVGPPLDTLRRALDELDAEGVRIAALARWRRSAAVPAGSGPAFVNGAAAVETPLAPHRLLEVLHRVERRLGRERRRRWAPRACDLDLIAYGDVVTPDAAAVRALMALGAAAAEAEAPEELILPHPRLQERAFVLAPLADVAPDWRHPLTRLSVAEMLAALPEAARAEVELLE